MSCKMCMDRTKSWSGDNPSCAFVDSFHENWNCATLNKLRDFVDEGNELPHYINYQYCDDDKYAIVNLSGMWGDEYSTTAMAMWISWYKNRGKTQNVLLLDTDGPGRIPTEQECLDVIKYLEFKRKEV